MEKSELELARATSSLLRRPVRLLLAEETAAPVKADQPTYSNKFKGMDSHVLQLSCSTKHQEKSQFSATGISELDLRISNTPADPSQRRSPGM